MTASPAVDQSDRPAGRPATFVGPRRPIHGAARRRAAEAIEVPDADHVRSFPGSRIADVVTAPRAKGWRTGRRRSRVSAGTSGEAGRDPAGHGVRPTRRPRRHGLRPRAGRYSTDVVSYVHKLARPAAAVMSYGTASSVGALDDQDRRARRRPWPGCRTGPAWSAPVSATTPPTTSCAAVSGAKRSRISYRQPVGRTAERSRAGGGQDSRSGGRSGSTALRPCSAITR